MERSLTKIRDVDLKILSELDDRDLFNYCKTHKYGRELCNNEDFWRNRVESKFPGAGKIKSTDRTWKNYYLKIVYYFNKYKYVDEAMFEAVRKNEPDLVRFFVMEGASDWSHGMRLAAYMGNRELVDFFIEKAKEGDEWNEYDWNLGLFASSQGGHVDLMKFFIEKGADGLNSAMYAAAAGGRKDAIEYLISQGANNWRDGLIGAEQSGNEELIAFFSNKLI